MPTTQSEDPNEKVNHPRWYNDHPSGIETIELIEHLPANFAMAVKYIWRCGLKKTETPLRDLGSAEWYTLREQWRIRMFELENEPKPKTEVVWRALAARVIEVENNRRHPQSVHGSALAEYLHSLLRGSFSGMLATIARAKSEHE